MLAGVFVQLAFFQHLHLLFYLTDFQRSQLGMLILLALQFAVAGFVVVRVAYMRGLGDPLSSIGWNATSNLILWGLIGFGFACAMTLASTAFFGKIEGFSDGFAPASILLYFLTTALVQPFIEECYFRGVLFVSLADKIGEVGSAVLTAVLFALLHPLHRLWVLPIGLMLGLARVRTRSVAACFALHGCYNVGILVFQLVNWR